MTVKRRQPDHDRDGGVDRAKEEERPKAVGEDRWTRVSGWSRHRVRPLRVERTAAEGEPRRPASPRLLRNRSRLVCLKLAEQRREDLFGLADLRNRLRLSDIC